MLLFVIAVVVAVDAVVVTVDAVVGAATTYQKVPGERLSQLKQKTLLN